MSYRRRLRRRRAALSRGLGLQLRALPRRLGFALLPLAALLLLGELVARLAWSPPEPGGDGLSMIPHPTRIWSLPPGTITADGVTHHIGANLLREVEETGAALRILTTGDSSIFGHGLEDGDTLHAKLRAALGAEGIDVDVICGATPGYSTAQTLVMLDEIGWDLDPDLLLIGNLWSDNAFQYFVDSEWLAALNTPARRVDRALSWSRAWAWLRSRNRPEVSDDGRLPIGWVRAPYDRRDGRRRVPLAQYGANLDTMLREAARRGVGAIALAPSNRARLEPDGSLVMWEPYFDVMARVMARRGVPLVDATEVLAAAGLDADAAFLDQMHPTGAGNAAYAEAIARTLLTAGWPEHPLIPDPSPPPVQVTERDPFQMP